MDRKLKKARVGIVADFATRIAWKSLLARQRNRDQADSPCPRRVCAAGRALEGPGIMRRGFPILLLAATLPGAFGCPLGQALEAAPSAPVNGKVHAANSESRPWREELRRSTPPFSGTDRAIVERALARSGDLVKRNADHIRWLIAAALGEPVSGEIVDWFFREFEAKLEALAPEQRIYDGRRSKYRLPGKRGEVHHYFTRNHQEFGAFVTEVALGEFVVFIGESFFQQPLDSQAQGLVHEVLHMLGEDFTDEAFVPVLEQFPWYDPKASASRNLQMFFEKTFR